MQYVVIWCVCFGNEIHFTKKENKQTKMKLPGTPWQEGQTLQCVHGGRVATNPDIRSSCNMRWYGSLAASQWNKTPEAE